MSLLMWIGIAASVVVGLSLMAGLLVGRILGVIGSEVSCLLETWPQASVVVPPREVRRVKAVRSQQELLKV
jgi:hypothetical protein